MKKWIREYGYKLSVVVTAALVFISFRDYFSQFAEEGKSAELFPVFFKASGVVLLYAVPIALLIRYLVRRFRVSGKVVLLSVVLGFTLPLYLSSEGNSLISYFLLSMNLPQDILDAWGAALTAPFAEEIAKGLVVLLVFWFCKGLTLKEAFVSGMISGFGFQVLEDLSYIFFGTFAETNSGFSIAFERVSQALGSHMAFTVVLGVGLVALMKKNAVVSRWKALFFLLAPVILHFVWNSPLEGDWVTPLLGAININLAYLAFVTADRSDECSLMPVGAAAAESRPN